MGRRASAALQRVLQALHPYERVVHIAGNHDLSALSSADVARLEVPAPTDLTVVYGTGRYFDVHVATGWHLLVIDTYDISVKRCPVAARRLRSELLAQCRKCRMESNHLREHEELNGAIGAEQLQWLQDRLKAARANGDRMVLLTHAPLRPEPTYYRDALCWNWDEVDAVLDAHADVVAAVISGHDHFGGDVLSAAGVYHCIMEAAMEGELGTPTHAVLELYSTGLALRGQGSVRSWE